MKYLGLSISWEKRGGLVQPFRPFRGQTRLVTRIEMISIEDQYFSLGKTLLLSIGLWPYQQPLFAQLHYLFVFGILISAILFQVRPNMELKHYTYISYYLAIRSACQYVCVYVRVCVYVFYIYNLHISINILISLLFLY